MKRRNWLLGALSSSIYVALEDKIAEARKGQKNRQNRDRLNVRLWPKADIRSTKSGVAKCKRCLDPKEGLSYDDASRGTPPT